MKVKQKCYGNIEVDNTEPDIVMTWMTEINSKTGKKESQVIHIERENLKTYIEMLTKCLNSEK